MISQLKDSIMRQAWPKILIRLPEDARAFVANQAERNGSSLNSEIIRCIRDRMEQMPGACQSYREVGNNHGR
jgi:hypothetical protein